MPNRLTQLEILEADHPGILIEAKQHLDRGKSSHTVAQLLSTAHGVTLSKSTVEKYRRKRWQVEREQLAQQKRDFQTAAKAVGQHGLSAAASAILFQEIRTLKPRDLVALLRVDVQSKTLKLKQKALRDEAHKEQSSKDKWEKMTDDEKRQSTRASVQAMRDIFGLGTHEEEAEKKRIIDQKNAEYFRKQGLEKKPT